VPSRTILNGCGILWKIPVYFPRYLQRQNSKEGIIVWLPSFGKRVNEFLLWIL